MSRIHAADLWQPAEADVQHLMSAVLAVGATLRAVLEPAGMNVIHSPGRAASQTVFHAHVHLVPRLPGDAMGEIWPPRQPPRDETAPDELARRADPEGDEHGIARHQGTAEQDEGLRQDRAAQRGVREVRAHVMDRASTVPPGRRAASYHLDLACTDVERPAPGTSGSARSSSGGAGTGR